MNATAPRISRGWWRGFGCYARWYLARHFHGQRLTRTALPALPRDEPVVVYANHPSWWDPLVLMVLADHWLGDRRHHAPMDAAALRQYPFFRKLGFFGVEQEGGRGAATFLRTGRAIVQAPGTALWITAEGRFTDVRRRPVELRPGLAHLLGRMSRGRVVPVAIELVFWDQRLPEALLHVGEAVDVTAGPGRDVEAWNALLAERLSRAQDELAVEAMGRDASRFVSLLEGSTGVGGVYDVWRRMRAWASGRRFEAEHGRRQP